MRFKDIPKRTHIALCGLENYTRWRFKRKHGYRLRLENPQTFSEKLQWIKLRGHMERFARYSDKYDVRSFVAEQIGQTYLVPLIGVYTTPDEIDWDTLPASFVIKATHGSGWNILVSDKTKADWRAIRRILNRWVKTNFYSKTGEANYKPLHGRLVVEHFLHDPSGDLRDYKFFCFNGEPSFIQVDGSRFSGHRRDLYDMDWKLLPVRFGFDHLEQPATKPSTLPDMIRVSRQLARQFNFVRVDLYSCADHVYFGELTFTPENGLKPFEPIDFDYQLGVRFDLDQFRRHLAATDTPPSPS